MFATSGHYHCVLVRLIACMRSANVWLSLKAWSCHQGPLAAASMICQKGAVVAGLEAPMFRKAVAESIVHSQARKKADSNAKP